jgi:hypothetical protein
MTVEARVVMVVLALASLSCGALGSSQGSVTYYDDGYFSVCHPERWTISRSKADDLKMVNLRLGPDVSVYLAAATIEDP